MKTVILILICALLNFDFKAQKLKESDVPTQVKQAFSKNYPNNKVEEWEKENMNYDERNVVVCHGYISGLVELDRSDSERPLSIGGTEYVEATIFKDFEYTALGHLHGAQKVTGDSIRYAGSLLKYSFSDKKNIDIMKLTTNSNAP